MKLILYELNEVPWRVLDDFATENPKSNLAGMLPKSRCYNTTTPDAGFLEPWITWPTFHRGVSNSEHDIQFLGQDRATFKFDPSWTLLKNAGHSVGVFGSFQSWPPPPLGPNDFFVPDCFAADDRCHPPELASFQRFVLKNVASDNRFVRSRPSLWRSIGDAWTLFRSGVRTGTLAAAAGQILGERRDHRRAYRRAVFQFRLGFDVYAKLWGRLRPDFSCFLTNHMAGLMHRYWAAKYPADYMEGHGTLDPFFAEALDHGMEVADQQLGALQRMADREGALLVVAGSMGQKAVPVPPQRWRGEIAVRDEHVLARAIGIDVPMRRLVAAEPRLALLFESVADLESFDKALKRVTDAQGEPLFSSERAGRSLSVETACSADVLRTGHIRLATPEGPTEIPVASVGLEIVHPDSPGTAHHSREGALFFYGKEVQPGQMRRSVSTLDFMPTVLDLFGIDPPSYLQGQSLVPELFGRAQAPSRRLVQTPPGIPR